MFHLHLKMKTLRVLELYSGIGGLHFALKETDIPHEVVAAADLNTTANKIYKHNFGDVKVITKCIEAITLKEFNQMDVDLLHMSPPCQPYCRIGKQKDVADDRTKSFLQLLTVLPKLDKPISYILVENVKGFDTSESRDLLLAMLKELQYNVQEFLLSPLQFGIPNSRLRYYLIAKQTPFNFDIQPHIRTDIPQCVLHHLVHRQNASATQNTSQPDTRNTSANNKDDAISDCVSEGHIESSNGNNTCDSDFKKDQSNVDQNDTNCDSSKLNTFQNNDSNSTIRTSDICNQSQTASRLDQSNELQDPDINNQSQSSSQSDSHLDQSDTLSDPEEDNKSELPLSEQCRHMCKSVGYFLEEHTEESLNKCLLPEKYFHRFWVMDLVTEESRNSCCFTKRYGRHMEGSGSIIEMNTRETEELINYKRKRVYNDEIHEAVRSRRLRFFSPREIANLMCFPKSFSIPDDVSHMQMYRCLGNSLNVHVVAVLLRLMTHGDGLEARQ